MVEIRVTPRSWTPLFSDGRLVEPRSLPHLSFRTEVKTLKRYEDHANTNKGFFLKIHLHPFLEKGLAVGQE